MIKFIKDYFQNKREAKIVQNQLIAEKLALQERDLDIIREQRKEEEHIEEHHRLTEKYKDKATEAQLPFLKVSILMSRDGQMQTDVNFNKFAIGMIDTDYQSAEVDYYHPTMDDNAKVAIYLSDTLNTIAANYLPDEFKEVVKDAVDEYENDVPELSGNFDKQVVDLGLDVMR